MESVIFFALKKKNDGYDCNSAFMFFAALNMQECEILMWTNHKESVRMLVLSENFFEKFSDK